MEEYFVWLTDFIKDGGGYELYHRLLHGLFDTEFIFSFEMDENRAIDGLDMRKQYERETGCECGMCGLCSVLEMMVALAVRCEREIMNIPDYGDRTYIWFWSMVNSLGLIYQTDEHFDRLYFRFVMHNFMNHDYNRDGQGGLFYVKGRTDMRELEIWYQMNMFLNEYMKNEGV